MVDVLNALVRFMREINDMKPVGVAAIAVLAMCAVSLFAIWVLGGRP
ncbi:MAG: hypothetical protein J0L65_16615 [Xanthomonadales bacterium]|nr:hypothetical protein [Xanthomonadales bacterium]